MPARVRWLLCIGLGLGLGLAAPPARLDAQGPAVPEPRPPEVADLDDASAIAAWRRKLDEARDRRLIAQQRVEAAHDAYADWRQRRVPRGVRKEKLVREVSDAETELAEAQAAWQELAEAARRAGVPPGVLRDYE
jgi:malate synthase